MKICLAGHHNHVGATRCSICRSPKLHRLWRAADLRRLKRKAGLPAKVS